MGSGHICMRISRRQKHFWNRNFLKFIWWSPRPRIFSGWIVGSLWRIRRNWNKFSARRQGFISPTEVSTGRAANPFADEYCLRPYGSGRWTGKTENRGASLEGLQSRRTESRTLLGDVIYFIDHLYRSTIFFIILYRKSAHGWRFFLCSGKIIVSNYSRHHP